MDRIRSFFSKNGMFVILVFTMVFFEFLIGTKSGGRVSLFSSQNLTNLIAQNGYVVILATGMLMCILTGGNIDLSVGSIVILVGAVVGILIETFKVDPYLAIAVGIVVGILLGSWQGFWIAYMNIPPFIVTLAGMLAFRGLALILMKSQSIGPFPVKFKAIFNNFIPSSWISSNPNLTLTVSVLIGVAIVLIMVFFEIFSRLQRIKKGYNVDNLFWTIARLTLVSVVVLFMFFRLGQHNGVQMLLLWLGAIVLIYTYFTQNTTFGRYLYAMGGNEKAARLSGVNTKRMLFFAYVNMGFLTAVTTMVCVARFNQASTLAGSGYEMDAIGACYIGGASAYGGVGKVGGVVIGAAFMGVLNMGMSILGWDQNLQRVIKGLVLLGAVAFDVISKNRKQAV